jgi:hypothetical protein
MRTVGLLKPADQAKALIDSDMVLVTEAGDRNVDLRLAISRRAGLGERHGSSGINVLLICFGGHWPNLLPASPALIASFSSCLLRCLAAAMRVVSTICPSIARYPLVHSQR